MSLILNDIPHGAPAAALQPHRTGLSGDNTSDSERGEPNAGAYGPSPGPVIRLRSSMAKCLVTVIVYSDDRHAPPS
jgi:hypothetical protein